MCSEPSRRWKMNGSLDTHTNTLTGKIIIWPAFFRQGARDALSPCGYHRRRVTREDSLEGPGNVRTDCDVDRLSRSRGKRGTVGQHDDAGGEDDRAGVGVPLDDASVAASGILPDNMERLRVPPPMAHSLNRCYKIADWILQFVRSDVCTQYNLSGPGGTQKKLGPTVLTWARLDHCCPLLVTDAATR